MPTWKYSARIGYGKDGFKPSGGCLHMRSNPRPLTEARRGEAWRGIILSPERQ